MSYKDLVVELGDNMGTSDLIESIDVEEYIHGREVLIVYL